MRRVTSVLYQLLRRVSPARALVRRVRGALAQHRPQAWLLHGAERDSGTPLAILFAGQLENKNYLAHLAFAGSPMEVSFGRRWLRQLLPPGATRPPNEADLLVVEMPERLRQRYEHGFEYFIPCWVGGEVAFAHAFERWQRSKNAKEDLRRMRKHEMTYEVTRNPAAFERFYTQMYLPYVYNIFGDHAFLMSREEMVAAQDHAELFLLKVRGEVVLGQIVVYEPNRARAWSVGVKDGDRSHLKSGAMKALDYLLFQYLAEKGYQSVHMGASRPFLRDGALNYKKRLGMRLTDYGSRGFAVRCRAESLGARAFLAGNPFIHVDGRRLKGAVFADPAALGSEQARTEYRAQYEFAGVSETTLFSLASLTTIGARPSASTKAAGATQGHSIR
jgi:hypothetical protein